MCGADREGAPAARQGSHGALETTHQVGVVAHRSALGMAEHEILVGPLRGRLVVAITFARDRREPHHFPRAAARFIGRLAPNGFLLVSPTCGRAVGGTPSCPRRDIQVLAVSGVRLSVAALPSLPSRLAPLRVVLPGGMAYWTVVDDR